MLSTGTRTVPRMVYSGPSQNGFSKSGEGSEKMGRGPAKNREQPWPIDILLVHVFEYARIIS